MGVSYSSSYPYVSASTLVTTSPNIATNSVLIIGANANRKGFMVYNNSANSVYMTYGATSTSSGCSVIIPTFANYMHNLPINYTGPLSGIRNAGTGTVIVTEFI